MIRAGLLLGLVAVATPAAAADPALDWPLDCSLGDSCFVQNYVDDDPGPEARDYTCGPLTYDGHKGTDIALRSMAAMRAGVTVRAAAPGWVRAVRDGEPDDASVRPGKECGNGVVIDHGGGWQSQYCHMKQGSIAVEPGQKVTMGTMLGQVGLSGQTEFPHLHFELRRDGDIVDPFSPDARAGCAEPGGDQGLWPQAMPYLTGGLVSTGMATLVPDFETIKTGDAAETRATPDAPALVVWAQVYGSRPGDLLVLRIIGPDGSILISREVELERAQARLFRAIGKRRPANGWPAGSYLGNARLLRDGQVLGDEQQARIVIGQ